jgi:hypothetical protein
MICPEPSASQSTGRDVSLQAAYWPLLRDTGAHFLMVMRKRRRGVARESQVRYGFTWKSVACRPTQRSFDLNLRRMNRFTGSS